MNNGNLKNQVFSGLIWKFAERILAQGVSFIVSVVLARILMPSDYGIVALILVFINIANVFVTSGFSTALVQNKDANSVDFSTNFYCSLAMSILVYWILFAIAPFLSQFYEMPDLALILRVFALRIPLSAYSAIQHAYVERNMIFKRYFFSTLGGTLISGVVGIMMAYNGFGAWALIAQYFTNTIVDIFVLSITVPWHPEFLFSWKSAKSMMNYGWKILAADLSGTFFDQLRSLIVGKAYTSADLAFYNKGNQLPSLITTNISSSIMTVLFPAIANISDEKKRVKEMTRKAVKIMSYVMFPMLFGLAAVSKPLVNILFTSKWEAAIPFVQILSISSAISLIGGVSLQAIKAIGKSDIILKLEIYKKPIYVLLLVIGVKVSVKAVAGTMLMYSIYGNIVNENYKHYVDFPEYIEEKFQKGQIGMAHFSDLLRISLLAQWGGMWIDATALCTDKKFFEYVSKQPLFVFKQLNLSNQDDPPIIASNWYISCETNNPIILLTRNLLYSYWKDHDFAENYFIFHLFFAMACRRYKEEWNSVPTFNNNSPHVLMFELSSDYTNERWKQLMKMSGIHKLQRYEDYSDLKNSNYCHILNEYLNN